MKKLFTVLTLMLWQTIVLPTSASESSQPYSECVGQCVEPCVGKCDGGKFYIGTFGGANWIDLRHNHPHLENKSGFVGGASVGYKYESGLRSELEVAYRRNPSSRKDFDGHHSHGHLSAWSVMANALYDFDQVSDYLPNVVPYVGVGVGGTQVNYHLKRNDRSVKAKGYGLTFQGIAGVGYRLNENTTIGIEYRCLGGEKIKADHGVALSLRRSF